MYECMQVAVPHKKCQKITTDIQYLCRSQNDVYSPVHHKVCEHY